MKRYLPIAIVVLVGLITLASATMFYRAKRLALSTTPSSRNAPSRERGEREEKEGEEEARESRPKAERAQPVHMRGNPNAPVILEEFGDFECPPCANISGFIREVEKEYGSRLCVVFTNFPLINHAHAKEAACAAEAAGMQGKYWEMHDLLYREQSVWSKAKDIRTLLKSYAGILRLDIDRFDKDLDGPQARIKIDADQKRGATLGVTSTPSIFLNDNMVPPASLNPANLRAAIMKMMNEKSPP